MAATKQTLPLPLAQPDPLLRYTTDEDDDIPAEVDVYPKAQVGSPLSLTKP